MANTTTTPTSTSPRRARRATQPLSSSETVLWNIERDPALRSTIVVVALLSRPPDLARLRVRVAAAADAFPRLRQRVESRRANVPRWVEVDDLDLDHHVRRVRLPTPGSMAELLDFAGEEAGEAFDAARPLWSMTIVEGLARGRAAMVFKLHHAMTDGVGGVGLLPLFTDLEPSPSPGEATGRWQAEPSSRPSSGTPGLGLLGAVGSAVGAALSDPVSAADAAPRVVRSIGKLLAPATRPLSPVATARGLDRHLDTLDVPLEGLTRAGRSVGGTLNDAFLAAVAGGLRRYHLRHGVEVESLRVTMPISTRRAGDAPGGNRFTPVRFPLPTGIDDPAERMRALGGIARAWRSEPAVGLTNVLAGVLSHLPSEVTTSIFGSMLKGVDFVATNIPGTKERSWLAGAEVLRLYGFGPTSGAAVSVALLSHLDTCGIGINSDVTAIPDPEVLTACLAESMDEVVAVGRRPTPEAGASTLDATGPEPARGRRRLSALDASFLALESATTPMHVGALIVMEGGPLTDDDGRVRIEAIREEIASRLDRCPRMRQRIAPVPYEAARPVWVEDAAFDIADHVRSVELPPPGSREQLERLCSELQMQTLDRSRPLWEMWLVGGLADGSVGLVYKVHHAVVDGVSATETFELLLDPRPLSTAVRSETASSPRGGRGGPALVRDGIADDVRTLARTAAGGLGLLRDPGPALAAGRGLTHLLRHTAIAPRSSLNQPVGDRRRLAIVDLDLGEVKRIGRARGATVNDVVLALVSSGLGALFADRGESSPNVQILVPVSLRPPTDRGSLGNQVTALVVRLPVADRASAALAQVVAETSRLKSGPDGAGLDLLLRWTDTWPLPLLRWTAGLVHHQPLVNLVITNVRGPAEPLALLGAELTQIVPIVPLGGNLTVGVAVLSYRGRLAIGLHADADAVPDLDVLVSGIDHAFAELASSPPERPGRLARGSTARPQRARPVRRAG